MPQAWCCFPPRPPVSQTIPLWSRNASYLAEVIGIEDRASHFCSGRLQVNHHGLMAFQHIHGGKQALIADRVVPIMLHQRLAGQAGVPSASRPTLSVRARPRVGPRHCQRRRTFREGNVGMAGFELETR